VIHPHPRRLALLAATMIWVACTSPEEQFAKHLRTGAELAEQGQIENALLEYRSALKLDPRSAEVNERLGRLLQTKADPGAAAYLRDAYQLDSERVEAGMTAARLLLLTDPEGASKLIAAALQRAPRTAIVHQAESDLALVRGDSRRAIAAARKALAIEPENKAAWYQLGKAYQARIFERNQRDRLAQAGRRRRRPSLPDSVYEAAIDAFGRADQLAEGGDIHALIEKARVFGGWPGHEQEAEKTFKRAMKRAVWSRRRRDQLAVAEGAVHFAQASQREDFRRWGLRSLVRTMPDHVMAWRQLAELENNAGGDGLKVLQRLLDLRPDDAAAHIVFTDYLIERPGGLGPVIAHLRGLLERGLDAPEIYEQLVRAYAQRGKLNSARKTYEQLSEQHPEHTVTRRAAARLAIAEGRYDVASKQLRSLSTELGEPGIQLLLARSELLRGDLPNAMAAVERAIPKTGKPSPTVLRLKARIHHEAQEWPLVVNSYQQLAGGGAAITPLERLMLARALYESNQSEAGRHELIDLLASEQPPAAAAVEYARREGREDRASAYDFLKQARERAPTDLDVIEVLTDMDLAAGSVSKALKRIDRSIESQPLRPEMLMLRARVLTQLGQLERAELDALRAHEADPELDALPALLFSIYLAQNSLLEAQHSFEEAQMAGVLHPGAQLLLARLYLHHGERAKARQMLEVVLAARPTMLRAKNDLAYLLAEEGTDLDRAMELAEQAQQLASRDASVVDTVGFVYLRKGLFEAALQQFRYAIQLSMDARRQTSVYHYHLGLALNALDRNAEAGEAFEKALELDSDFANADDARSQLEAARARNPKTPRPS
jgi:tetratricopeptide (TPR) repeat protein